MAVTHECFSDFLGSCEYLAGRSAVDEDQGAERDPCEIGEVFTTDGRTKIFPDPRAIVPPGPASVSDRPVDSASKNTRDLIEAEFDMLIGLKMQHVPYPQRRSVVRAMEERFPRAFNETARHRFRHYTDVNTASCFSHYYALATGAAVRGDIAAMYTNDGAPWAPLQMRRLLQRRNRAVFCLNEGVLTCRRRDTVDMILKAFLEAYFPVASAYERSQ
jgi:hypothetical protein